MHLYYFLWYVSHQYGFLVPQVEYWFLFTYPTYEKPSFIFYFEALWVLSAIDYASQQIGHLSNGHFMIYTDNLNTIDILRSLHSPWFFRRIPVGLGLDTSTSKHEFSWWNFPVTVRCNSGDCLARQLFPWKITGNSPRKSNGQSAESSGQWLDSSHNATGLQMYGSRGTNIVYYSARTSPNPASCHISHTTTSQTTTTAGFVHRLWSSKGE